MSVAPCPNCRALVRDDRPCSVCKPSMPGLSAVALLGLLVAGCGPTDGGGGDSQVVALYGVEIVDDDNDGYSTNSDCDDTNANIHPCADDPAGDGDDTNCDGIDGVDPNVDQGCT